MGGGGRDQAGEVLFASGVCPKAPKMQICPETFVHDCISCTKKSGSSCTSSRKVSHTVNGLQPFERTIE